MKETNEVSEAQQRGNYRLVANKSALLFVDSKGECTTADVETMLDRNNKDFLRAMPESAFVMASYTGFQMGDDAVQAGNGDDVRINFLRKRENAGLTYAQVTEAIEAAKAENEAAGV